MSLRGIADETLAIVERGGYQAPSGAQVSLRAELARALEGTRLFRPEELAALLAERQRLAAPGSGAAPRLELREESTSEAGQRLALEGAGRVVALNFASARNPGGGFLRGARAQEEDLARASALYPCQLRQPGYYQANRATGSLLYTDHLIYSPDVPFFRDRELRLLERPFLLSVLTVPAPNAGELLRREPGGGAAIHEALIRRAGMLLAVAALERHRTLVLGAWGCGVFRNDPSRVAEVFLGWLRHEAFAGCFERVVFAIVDKSPQKATFGAFAKVLCVTPEA